MLKQRKVILLLLILIMLTGCSKVIKFKKEEINKSNFHKIEVAEKINNGLLYYDGDKILYDNNGEVIELATKVKSLFREDNNIYYVSENTLYNYNLDKKETKKMVNKPHNILGKYNDNIISYSGRTIYSINGTKKTKLFKDGYYLNNAVLYNNKVYGIPASNVYEYNLDTLKVNKITNNPNASRINIINNQLWVITNERKKNKSDYLYYKFQNNKLEKMFSLKNTELISNELVTKDGFVIETSSIRDTSTKNNKLLYVQNGKIKKIDKDYSYEVIGIYNNKLCYYKNNYQYGSEQENLKGFYLYNGKEKEKAFNLDVNYYEDIKGFEYDNGLLIEVIYESGTSLYKYNGNKVEPIDLPDNIYRINALDIIDSKAYLKYSDGEESMNVLGTIIDLK